MSGQHHVRHVQARLRDFGGDRGALTRVVAMGWLLLEGEYFNVVLGVAAAADAEAAAEAEAEAAAAAATHI